MIITLTEAKTLLQLDSSKDALITMLIPLIEADIVNYCNNEFIEVYKATNGILPVVYTYSNTISFLQSDNSINDPNNDFTTTNFKASDSIRVYNTLNNDQTFTITSVAAHKIILNAIDTVNNESAGNTIVIARCNYPKNLKIIASQMIKYLLQKQNLGFKSESIDDYSYTLADNINSYPVSILSGLNQYRSLYKKTIPFNLLYFREV